MLAVVLTGVLVAAPAGTESRNAILPDQATHGSLGRAMVGAVVDYVVAAGDTFETIADRFGVDPTALARRNTRWVHAPLLAGMKLTLEVHRTVPAFRSGLAHGILINIPQKLLFLIEQDGTITAIPVGLGQRDWPTPTGTFHVARKEIDPTWDVPLSIQQEMKRLGRPVVTRVPPGPQNPLGKYWIGLSLPNLGIHATNAPASVPGHTTHGCIRLGSEHMAFLFDRVTVGAPGEIIYEPVLLTRHDGRFFVEAHPDVYGRRPRAPQELLTVAETVGVHQSIDWSLVNDVVRRREGLAVDVTMR
jgi:L,D-transpeptidase ErfK/SrfK